MGKTVAELMSSRVGNAISNIKTWGGIIYNVKEFGAKGDGKTDDTSAIQHAIDQASIDGGGEVFLPPSDEHYLVSQITVPSNVKIIGAGRNSKIKQISGISIHVLVIEESATDVVISGIALEASGGSSHGISTSNLVKNVIIEDCYVENAGLDGIYVSMNNDNVRILNNNIYNCGRHGVGVGDNNRNIVISRNYINTTTNGCINFIGYGVGCIVSENIAENTTGIGGYGASNEKLLIIANIIRKSNNTGVHVFGKDHIIADNIIENPKTYGIYVAGSSEDPTRGSNIVISANRIDGADSPGIEVSNIDGVIIDGNIITGNTQDAIRISSLTQLNIVGNKVSGTSPSGNAIRITNSQDGLVQGNELIGNASNAIRFQDSDVSVANRHFVIIGNIVKDNGGTGILSQNNADYFIVTNNISKGNSSGQISLAGSNNVSDNNITA